MSAANEGGGAGGLNVEALLAPIAGENPSGVSLFYEGVYKEIRAARKADDQMEQGAWKRERKTADWPRVIELASEALATRSKDLQLGAWLTEALVQANGFAGLRDGLKVMRGLLLNFWDTLFPEREGDGLDARVNSLAWLDRQVSFAVRGVPVTSGVGDARYTFNDYEDAKRFSIPENLDDLDSAEREEVTRTQMKAADEGRINSEQWRQVRDTTPRAFYEETFALVNDCWAEFKSLDAATDAKFGDQTPGFPQLKRTLEALLELLGPVLLKKRELEPDAVPPPPAVGPVAPPPVEVPPPGTPVVLPNAPQPMAAVGTSSREEAYRKLVEAAAYFRQAEPHSPVSYLVERAVRWGQMPLEEWLAEVVKSEDVLLSLRETLGLRPTADGGEAEDGEGGG